MKITKVFVILILAIGCSDDPIENIPIDPVIELEPSAFFELNSIHEGKVLFNNLSENSSSFSWNFGDSNYSNLKNPSHQYTENGKYDVLLEAKNGDNTDSHSMEIEINDIFKDQWEKVGEFIGGKRSFSLHFKIGKKYYVGYGSDHSTNKMDFWEYNSETKIWSQKKNVPDPIYGGVSFVIDGTAYVGQGRSNRSPNTRFWKYNEVLDDWSKISGFPGYNNSTITGASAFGFGGKGYVINGRDTFTREKEFWSYNPTLDSWERLEDFPGKARHQSSHVIIDGKLYLFGGSNRLGDGNSTFYNDLWEFDFANQLWTQKSNFPGQGRVGSVGFVINNRAYFGLGWTSAEDYYYGDVKFTGDLWEYNPVNDTWTERDPFPDNSRAHSFVFEFDDYVWVGLGKSHQGKEQNDIWKYKIER